MSAALSVCAVCIAAVCLSRILDKTKSFPKEFIGAAAGVLIFIWAIKALAPAVKFLKEMQSIVPNSGISLLIKSLSIALLCSFTADLCRDLGEPGTAAKSEFAGKIILLLLSLPLVKYLLETATEFLGR